MKTVSFDLHMDFADCKNAQAAKLKMASRLIAEGFPVEFSGNLLEPEITIAGTCRVTETMDRRVRTFVLFEDGDIIDD